MQGAAARAFAKRDLSFASVSPRYLITSISGERAGERDKAHIHDKSLVYWNTNRLKRISGA